MPKLDHKGPQGQGPRTGQGHGNCKKKSDVGKNVSHERQGEGKGKRWPRSWSHLPLSSERSDKN